MSSRDPPPPKIVKIAACHSAPVYLDPTATTRKALSLLDTAASNGANLVVFPESFIPGFPVYSSVLAPIDTGTCFSSFAAASIYADGEEIAALRQKAKEHGVVISMGFSERSRKSAGCLWNSNILIDDDGNILSHHRKLVPTYFERLVWSAGDGYGLHVCPTAQAGRVGVLICGENTNPLARYSLMAQDEEIHIASFPPAWPTSRVGGYKNKQANAVRGAAHAFEAKCFTIVCAGFLDETAIQKVAQGDKEIEKVLHNASRANTMFFGPDGSQIGDEMCEEEGIAYAECDVTLRVEMKKLHDVVGGYQRYDVFNLEVTRSRDEPVKWK